MKNTPFSSIYKRFLSKIKDYPFLKIIENDSSLAESMLFEYMESAVSHFTYSTKDLSFSDDDTNFNVNLTDLEIEIIALFMVSVYLSQYIVSTDKITEKLSSKDFRSFSPGNLINEVRETQSSNYERAVQLMVENHYRVGYK